MQLLSIPFHNIDPIIFQLGPLAFRWYGLMYALGFLVCYIILRSFYKKGYSNITPDELFDLIVYVFLGILLGGRLGYVFFYNWEFFSLMPQKIFAVWEGGMSFHGGLIGVVIALLLYSFIHKRSPLQLADDIITPIPLAIGLGRFGNYINGELYGKETDVPWCMVFPKGGDVCRHPSQLYELFFEGLLLFGILFLLRAKPLPVGTKFWIFLLGYGVARFSIEFVRLPDSQLGTLWGGLSMGQYLSLPMILVGGGMLFYSFLVRNKHLT